MTSVLALQRRLKSLSFDPGPLDGVWGPSTLAAINLALDKLAGIVAVPRMVATETVPAEWMPWARMERIIVHWTAGGNKASKTDKEHYHIIIEGDGTLVRGDMTIADNQSSADGRYAAHTLNCNSGSIGVALAGMAGAKENPFSPGRYPITETQWKKLPFVLADLSTRYVLPVAAETVLSHAEVEKTLGIKQRGKWDIAILPFDLSVNTAEKVGKDFRASTLKVLEGVN